MNFLKRIVIDDKGCWLFQGYLKKSKAGHKYGWVWFNKTNMGAHRASWIVHYGEIPDKLFVCHKCDVPNCLNPEHLFLGTAKDNVHDMINKGRKAPSAFIGKNGEKHSQAKLNVTQVIEIKEMLNKKISFSKIARLYNVSVSAIGSIKCGKNWASVKEGDIA
tara:strand:+ start:131 stop:616 length:486 start_codon:yes stop_codon:yes gene_type:complete